MELKDRLLELSRRSFAQIALLAAVDAQRVFELAETVEPMLFWLEEPDALERMQERLETYLKRYPDGGDYLREVLRA